VARPKNTVWQRYKFKLSALVLVLPWIFLYQQLNPSFLDAWDTKTLGPFEVTPMPYDLEQPYAHHDEFVKDFLLMFPQGDIQQIRQGYVSIGAEPIPLGHLQQGEEGILHGSRHSQHVHSIAPVTISATDKLWVQVELWNGDTHTTAWDIPESLLAN